MAGLQPLQPSGPEPVKVFDDLAWVMTGFNRLSVRRPQGMGGPLRIPVTEIEAYCRYLEFDYPRRREFLFYIERMDEVFMEFVAKHNEEEEKKQAAARAKAAGKKPPGRR